MADVDSFSTSTMRNALEPLSSAAATKHVEGEILATISPCPPQETNLLEQFHSFLEGFFDDPFSTSAIRNAFESLPFFSIEGDSPAVTPPLDHSFLDGFFDDDLIPTHYTEWLLNFMTSGNDEEDVASPFKEMISTLEPRNLHWLVYLLTSNSYDFLSITRNDYDSKRLQIIVGISEIVDAFFSTAISRHFLDVTTDGHAIYVALRGLLVFDEAKKVLRYEHTLNHALYIAKSRHCCFTLKKFITKLNDPNYKEKLLDIVVNDAISLANDVYGNYAVQHVLSLNDLRCTQKIKVNLRYQCVSLAFDKHGKFIVEKLLMAKVKSSVEMVFTELLECQAEVLVELAMCDYGHFVVAKALTLKRKRRACRFRKLMERFFPFLKQLNKAKHGRKIVKILCSIQPMYKLLLN